MSEFMIFRFTEFLITMGIVIIILAFIGMYFIINRIYIVIKAIIRIKKLKKLNSDYRKKKLYMCNPELNIKCLKQSCYMNDGDCWLTTNKAYRKDGK